MADGEYLMPEFTRLWTLFPEAGPPPATEPVPDDAVPDPHRGLLVHNGHMTETLESYWSSPVRLHVLSQVHAGDSYARMLVLSVPAHDNPPATAAALAQPVPSPTGPAAMPVDGRIVMFGLVRIDLRQTSPAVRAEILAGGTPLGRILINHNVLRRVEYHRCFRLPEGTGLPGRYVKLPTYGRLATIFCDGLPAIELVEIVGL